MSESANRDAADHAAIPDADQPPLPGLLGQASRRGPRGQPERPSPGRGGLTGHAAFDYGNPIWVSLDGVRANAYQLRDPRSPSGRRMSNDVVLAVSMLFGRGFDVVTEAPTPYSFAMSGRLAALVAVLDRYPDRTLFTIGAHNVRNELARQGVDYDSRVDDDLAAVTIWHLAAGHMPRRWKAPQPITTQERHRVVAAFPDNRPRRFDPVRPFYGGLMQMRSDDYPTARFADLVAQYLPRADQLTAHQRKLLIEGGHWRRDRCSALVWSLREPESRTRSGWERVIGASAHGRPSMYRQMLVVGKPHAHYRPRHHHSGLTFTEAMRALRGLRAMILAAHPDLPGTPP